MIRIITSNIITNVIMQYEMNLNPRVFDMVKMGTKTIEVRLFDEKRNRIKVDDEIEFTSTSDSTQKILTKIIKLYRYPTFTELYHSLPTKMFGGENIKELIENIYNYYQPEEEKKFGVIGIEIQRLI